MTPSMTAEQKQWIDAADYVTLLRKWRFQPLDGKDPLLMDECGDYYAKVMFAKRDADAGAAVAASKEVGWDQPL